MINKISHNKTDSTSIKKTLLIKLISFALFISILCGLTSSIIMYRNAMENMDNRISESATAYNHSVQNAIATYKAQIKGIASNSYITDTSVPLEERKAKMDALAKQYGFDSIVVTDATGNTSNGAHVGQRDYFKQAMAGKTYFSSTLVGSVTKKTEIIVATKANSNNYNGVVYGMLSSSIFSKMIRDVSIGDTGYGFIVDKDGKIIAHKDQTQVTKFINYIDLAKKDNSYSDISAIIKNMTQKNSAIQSCKFNGGKLTIGYQPISGDEGWSIGVVAKASEMLSEFYRSIYITVALTVLFIVLSVALAVKIANPLADPIIKLSCRVKLLADGDLQSEVPQVDANNEIGALSVNFRNTIQTLNGYIGEISRVLSSLEQGDCTVKVTQEYKGDFQAIKHSLNAIIANLNEIFSEIKGSSEQVAGGAVQVSNASQALAQGATEQASSIEELSATVTEISDKVKENASHALEANESMNHVNSGIEISNDHMKDMLTAMGQIHDSSNQISSIIKTIEDIAFQTNILALNAAVEAARAGEAGKGFAVVADEVRNLAGKSAAAAKNTTGLISTTINQVENGSQIAGLTAESLSEVVDSINAVANKVNNISQATEKQSDAIMQVTTGVDQISDVVQTNSASAEESAAASEELSGQAQTLKAIVGRFKLNDSVARK
mgnify:CR=1 FL=1